MLARRDFLKLFAACSLPTTKPNGNYNLLEYIDCEISFPFAINNDTSCLKIYQLTLLALENIYKDPNETILISMGNDENTLYDPRIDNLLCTLTMAKHSSNFNYPVVKFFYKKKEIQTPEMSLLCFFKNPIFYFSKQKKGLFSPTIKNFFTSYFHKPYYPLDQLVIHIRMDLEYRDFDRPNKLFDLRAV